jgi:hypothetical protein
MDFWMALALMSVSILGNGILFYFLRRARKAPRARKNVDITAADLLHDLTGKGQAILRVTVLDPTSLLLRSPRD